MERTVIVSTRVPEPGRTKTRMIPALSTKGCVRLHTCFPEDVKRECGKAEGQLFIYFTPGDGKERSYPVFGRGEHYISRRGSGLGERIYQAIREVLGRGYEACILMGTDAPEVRSEYLERASGLFEQSDVILGPTRDRGYYLVDMKEP